MSITQASLQPQAVAQNDFGLPRWDVFISHAPGDTEEAGKITQALRLNGLSVWLDVEHDLPAQRWSEDIEQAIRRSRLLVPIISSSTKHWGRLMREWGAIIGRTWDEPEIGILPVLLDDIDPPGFLSDRRYIISGHETAKLKEAADKIVRYMVSPESVVDDLKLKPADPEEWKEHFRNLRKFIQELREREEAAVA